MNDKHTVVVAVNDNYAPYLSVLIKSIVMNTKKENRIEIVVLYMALSEKNKALLNAIIENTPNIQISYQDVTSYFADRELFVEGKNHRSYLSKETYFRLVVPWLLNEYSKILYLDSDVIVREGWEKIFNFEISDCFVAAVNDIWGNWECYRTNSELAQYRKKELGLEEPKCYFNAGVLLFNLERFRTKFQQDELLDLASSREWRKHDQDVLNHISKGAVKWLDFSWNLIESPGETPSKIISNEILERYEESFKQPHIIHYATRKPWMVYDMMYLEEFWKYAFFTPYHKYLFQHFIESQLTSGIILQEHVLCGIKDRKIGVRFIIRCFITWFKAVCGMNR